MPRSDVEAAITRLAREEGGRVIALLTRRFGSLDLADESVQDALVKAAESWTDVPKNPAAWLYTVARNAAVDRLRREASARRRGAAAASEFHERASWEEEPSMIDDSAFSGDEHLRLMLLCCHPALDRDTQVALTLRLVGGLTTPEIASAFLLPEATLAQRIVRAKRKIRDAGIPLSIPASLDERVGALLGMLYLIFNEGYLSRSVDGVRVDLVDESVRLTRQLLVLHESAEVEGLLALELYTRARASTRVDGAGELVLLGDQDRTRWDGDGIREANAVLGVALQRMRPGAFQLQALIAAQHMNARTAADTDWPHVAVLYAQLMFVQPSPVVALNHAVAVSMADGPRAGLALVDGISGLDDYYLLHSTRGELLLRDGLTDAAAAAFTRALSLATNPAERRHLERRLAVAAR